MKNTFGRDEKLKQKKQITLLFEKGKWKSCGSLRLICIKEHEAGPRTGVSVSKKFFKKAVDRNRIKRLLREAYRLNKNLFHESFGEKSICMIFWISPKMPKNFAEVEQEFLKICTANRK